MNAEDLVAAAFVFGVVGLLLIVAYGVLRLLEAVSPRFRAYVRSLDDERPWGKGF